MRSVKHGLKAAMPKHNLTDETLLTVLKEVQNMVNGRPLTSIGALPSDPEPLTPHHIRRPYVERAHAPDIPEFNQRSVKARHKESQEVSDRFWRCWRREYLPNQAARKKWNIPRENLQIGDIVSIRDDNLVRDRWMFGRVINTFPGKDGVVRVVVVRTTDGKEREEPVSRVCLLEAQADFVDIESSPPAVQPTASTRPAM